MSSTDGFFREVGKVADAFIGFEDHGILTISLTMDFGDSRQSAGNYNLNPQNGSAASNFLIGILGACNVTQWEKVKGTVLNVLYTAEPGLATLPVGLEPLPFNQGSQFLFASAFNESET